MPLGVEGDVVCLQETKLCTISMEEVSMCGGQIGSMDPCI